MHSNTKVNRGSLNNNTKLTRLNLIIRTTIKKIKIISITNAKKFDESQKNNTPSCIKYYMNKININRIHITIFCMPKNQIANVIIRYNVVHTGAKIQSGGL